MISENVSVTSGLNATLVANLDDMGAPALSVYVNDFSAASPQVFARHSAAFSAVDVAVDVGTPSEVAFTGLTNGNQAGGGLGATGTYRVTIAPTTTTTYVYDQMLQLTSGTFYAAYAVGTPSNNTFEVVLQAIPQ